MKRTSGNGNSIPNRIDMTEEQYADLKHRADRTDKHLDTVSKNINDLSGEMNQNAQDLRGEMRDLRGEMNQHFSSFEQRFVNFETSIHCFYKIAVLIGLSMVTLVLAVVIKLFI